MPGTCGLVQILAQSAAPHVPLVLARMTLGPCAAARRDHETGAEQGVVVTAIGERQRAVSGGPRLDTRALVVFFALAYALSWWWVIPLVAAHEVVRRGEGWPTHLPACSARRSRRWW